MSTHPYIPLYVDDYDAHTSHLTAAEDGVYCRLLRLCWRTPGCSLPNDEAWIARKIRLTAPEFEVICRPVLNEFFRLQRGRLIQRRLKAEYDNISRKKSARVAAGKRGGDAKALKTRDKTASNASVLPLHTRAFPEPYPEPEKSSEANASGVDDAPPDLDKTAWQSAVDVLTRQGGLAEAQARKFFGKLISTHGLEARDLLPALSGALVNSTQEPQAYLQRSAQGIAKRRAGQLEKRVGWV